MPEQLIRIPCGNLIVNANDMFGSLDRKYWEKSYPPVDIHCIQISMNSLFIESGNEKILIDPGMSPGYMHPGDFNTDSLESPAEFLQNRGILPSEISLIILTHLHFDHCAGIFRYDRNTPYSPAFPEATLMISLEQLNYIAHPYESERDAFIENFIYYSEKFYPIKIILEDQGNLTGEISFRKYHGHNPGMMVPLINLAGKTLVFTTDLVPTSVNAEHKVVSHFDLNTERSLAEQKAFIAEAREKNYELLFYHEFRR